MKHNFRYTDVNGTINTIMFNDGENLSVTLRGINFSGDDFDSLSPAEGSNEDLLKHFKFCHGDLCSCTMECEIEIPVQANDDLIDGSLIIVLELGNPLPSGYIDKEILHLTLKYDNRLIMGSGESGWFEDELIEIQKQLLNGDYIKSCINCAYSDYSPFGHGLFGKMMCFRNKKEEYSKVRSKDEFWEVHDYYDRLVQETYLCEEFEKRVPGTGYRG
jgi:hypothetical protein